MGTENLNNRSTAMTPEVLGQLNADAIVACKQAFEAGVAAGKAEIIEEMLALMVELPNRQKHQKRGE